MGYHNAGFDVVGVDIEPQPNYPFEVVQADALEYVAEYWSLFAAIHASPTCQTRARVTAWRGARDNHPDTLAPMLKQLRRIPRPWVVENVTEAVVDGTLRPDVVLCGSMFGLPIRRHRAFETSWRPFALMQPCQHHRDDLPFMHKGERAFTDAMGCYWMTNREGRQAIPPAYTQFIGAQLLEHLRAVAA